MLTAAEYKVKPYVAGKKRGVIYVNVPGSKSITNRALLLAALADGKTRLKGALFSDDSRNFLKCIQQLGFKTEYDETTCEVTIEGHGGDIPVKETEIYVGSAGTAARFITAMLALSDGRYVVNASEQMKKRPMEELFEALESLGAGISYLENKGFLPVVIEGAGYKKSSVSEHVSINIDKSSQFLSALLIASVMCKKGLKIDISGSHGMAYIDITIKMMKDFGVGVEKDPSGTGYFIRSGQHYKSREYRIEPDVSAAGYFYAFAAVTGETVCVRHVTGDSVQGDIRLLDILEKMGCEVVPSEEGIHLKGVRNGEKLKGGTFDMGALSDQTMTIAAIAPFASENVRLTGIGHIRFQECNRLNAIVNELGRMGITCDFGEDYVDICPGTPKPARIETYDDHRVAMSFAITGLMTPGTVILNPGCCRKTFENFFEVLEGVCTDK